MKQKMVIGTRTSKLALWQANSVADAIKKAFPYIDVSLHPIITTGDTVLNLPMDKIGGKGLFTQELESSILNGEIDLAVHSLKDMPIELPPGLCIGAVMPRENPQDGFISLRYGSIDELPYGARVGTSSLRRRAQLLYYRPDLHISALRGNIDTRLRKLETENLDAIILAVAGLKRLGCEDRVTEEMSFDLFLPAAGQGALAVEARANDEEVLGILRVLQDEPTYMAVTAERSFLRVIGGGCQVPIGVYAACDHQRLAIQAVILDTAGTRALRSAASGKTADAVQIGSKLADDMLRQGGRELLLKEQTEGEDG